MISKIRKFLWNSLAEFYPKFLRSFYGMDISKTAIISWRAKLDKSINPRGIHIGENTWILADSVILAHDHSRGLMADTYIGDNCVIGIKSIVFPGLRIGNHVVIGAGSVVTKDIPDHCIAVGNPAKIIKENIRINNKGQII